MTAFQYHPEIVAAYPDVVGGIIMAEALQNGASPAALRAAYEAEQQAVRLRLGETPLSMLPALAAWRGVFRSFGVDPTRYRSAAEALLRRLTKQGSIPAINLLVDIGNLVSIRYALPVAVFDRRAVEGTLSVHFSDGTERFTTLNESESDQPAPGEVIFSDVRRAVLARRWCWRQSDESAARPDTTDAIITIEAHHPGAQDDIRAALRDLLALITEFGGGHLRSAVLTRDLPAW